MTEGFPLHLLLPLGSSLLVVVGLMLLKQAQERGVSAWAVTIAFSCTSAVVFSLLTALGGVVPSPWLLWQPAVIGALFLAGQTVTVLAVKFGDVSIAAPVQGTKVLLVPVLAMFLVPDAPPLLVWVAAAVAMLGIAFVQYTDATVERSRVALAVALALTGAVVMAVFDLLIQRWAPAWGAGTFLPIALAFSALFSLLLLPLIDAPRRPPPSRAVFPLAVGCVLMAVQAIGMTYTLAEFGDASRVNIVYSLRGFWGVSLTWILLAAFPSASPRPSHRVMATRLFGAVLILVSVVLAIQA